MISMQPWSSLDESPVQIRISYEIRPGNSVSEYVDNIGSLDITFDFKEALGKFIYHF